MSRRTVAGAAGLGAVGRARAGFAQSAAEPRRMCRSTISQARPGHRPVADRDELGRRGARDRQADARGIAGNAIVFADRPVRAAGPPRPACCPMNGNRAILTASACRSAQRHRLRLRRHREGRLRRRRDAQGTPRWGAGLCLRRRCAGRQLDRLYDGPRRRSSSHRPGRFTPLSMPGVARRTVYRACLVPARPARTRRPPIPMVADIPLSALLLRRRTRGGRRR